uniref:glutathione peroxidase n=1 Tax=Oncorhynchus tshawytscha TaxID=74940 RepID=A0AAZ3SDF5_ONCTS
ISKELPSPGCLGISKELPSPGHRGLNRKKKTKTNGTIYNYNAKTLNGSRSVSLREYMGKTVLFVNVLNALHKEMKDYGFTILGFPSNQFGKQEPGDNHEILASLKHVRPGNGFVPNFLLFQRGDVNGDTEQGVYTFLKNSCPPVGDSFGNPTNRLFWEPLKMNDIKWNFEKFLVGPDGKPVMRWFPRVTVDSVVPSLSSRVQASLSVHSGWAW